MEFEVFILDCDGVILNSNHIKTETFREVLREEGFQEEEIKPFIHYHQTHGGISRYQKFRDWFTVFLKKPVDEIIYEKLLKRYGEVCLEQLLQAELAEGFLEFIAETSEKKSCYVASGGDEEEIKKVFREKKLEKYFKDIFGSPRTKADCVKMVCEKEPDKKRVLIGDSSGDWQAAKNCGVEFIFMEQYAEDAKGMLQKAEEEGFRVIGNLADLI